MIILCEKKTSTRVHYAPFSFCYTKLYFEYTF